MKRQTQVPGVRRWFGDDFLELQSETLSAIDAFAGAYNKPCVVSGCAVSGGAVAKGYVALSAQGEGLKIMPFDGAVIATPCYLVAKKTSVNSVYADGVSRLSAYQYQAVAQAQAPAAGISFVKIETNGKCDRLPDVMQDTLHRLVTDSEKTAWNAKETPTGAQTKANQAKEDAIAAANTYIGQARREARDYTDAREVEVNKKVSTKADALTSFVTLPSMDDNMNAYDNRIGTWRNKGTAGRDARVITFADNDNGLQIRAVLATPAFGKEDFLSVSMRSKRAADKEYTPYYELYHKGNFNPSVYTPVICAGYVYSSGKTEYKGKGFTPSRPVGTTSEYKVAHNIGTSRYLVTITPRSGPSGSFYISEKTDSYFVVKFAANSADFEFSMSEY